ncbi:MAG TPA: hypothetical protein VHT96_02135 [Clostridia bacterium]|nr:hypothetical protein [Clostridia bacterium]
MFRNSILYRRWWYIKRRNTRLIRLLLRLAITALITGLAVLVSQSDLFHLITYFFSS